MVDNQSGSADGIDTTIVFGLTHYADFDPFTRMAEAVISDGQRTVRYVYDLSTEVEDEPELQVSAFYEFDGELRNESVAHQTYPVEDDYVLHAGSRQELHEFIEANAFGDPEASPGDEFESMVEVSE